jgi:hypothetical protein
MAKNSAERQRDFRQRVNAAAVRDLEAGLAAAAGRSERQDAVITDLGAQITSLEAQLEQAGSASQHSATCRGCGKPLACPQCSRGDDYA